MNWCLVRFCLLGFPCLPIYGDIVLENVKGFYSGYSIFESLFLAIAIALSVTFMADCILVELSYLYKIENSFFYLSLLWLLAFLSVLCFTLIYRINVRIERKKKGLVAVGVVFSLIIIRVVLA